MVKIKDLLLRGADLLNSVSDSPRGEARILLSHALGVSTSYVLIHSETDVEDRTAKLFESYVSQRANHKPVAYILGEKEFYGLSFAVNEHTLIPRPETEMVVEEILGFGGKSLLDLCTGSGCIPIAAAANSDITAHGVDICRGAVETAESNARLHSLSEKVTFETADIFEKTEYGKFDIISSNPPYITDADMLTLPPDVADFEPHTALAGGIDGLVFYRHIAEIAPQNLNPDGFLVLEIGIGEGDAVANLLENNFTDIKIKKDLAGIERIVTARLRRI
ncbi:MAG: peptide chain release factor N(5)-glutamine methyltransferase [Clostridia bacterium]|nr:peptide chain release factor N(5)-glutamine methyltransferase [Clostridia bacterium]